MPAGYPPGFADGPGARPALLVISALRGIKPRRLHALAWELGSPDPLLAAIRDGAAGSALDRQHALEADPAAIARRVEALGLRFVIPGDREYLQCLLDLQHDPPIGLFVSGRPLTELEPRVSIVGARTCSPLGNEVAMSLGAGLGGAGVCVVSGAARGIDAASHRGALSAGGTSIAVLGSGHDVPYPKGSAELIGRVQAAGAVVSEYPPGVVAEPFRFPARNRLVAALGDALVVVEGARGSGSMISVDHALDLGRDVFAVPGPVTSPLAEVPLALIRDGATMIRHADDLLADLGLAGAARERAPIPSLDEGERSVLSVLAAAPFPDAVAARLDAPVSSVISALVSLELKGLVRNVGGRYEARVGALEALGGPSG